MEGQREHGASTLKSIFSRMDSLLRPSGFVLLSAPFVCTYMCLCVCVSMSGRESMVFSLVISLLCQSSLLSPAPFAPYTPHILSEGPWGQPMNFPALRFGALRERTRLSMCQNGTGAISKSTAVMFKYEAPIQLLSQIIKCTARQDTKSGISLLYQTGFLSPKTHTG